MRAEKFKNQKFTTGFTLVEVLVAALVFSIIMISASGLFVQTLRLQKKTLGLQNTLENTQLAIEMMERDIRVSTITSGDAPCSGAPNLENQTITLSHPISGVITYEYQTATATSGGKLLRNDSPITASTVDIRLFAFCVNNSGNDGRQARVAIVATVASFGDTATDGVSFQTTVAFRSIHSDITP